MSENSKTTINPLKVINTDQYTEISVIGTEMFFLLFS